MPSASNTIPIVPSRPIGWIKRYIYFHGVRHPSEIGDPDVEAFLTHLAVKENVAASTQNQALSALLFLYRQVLHKDLGAIDALRAKKPKRLPTVLTKEEVRRHHLDESGLQKAVRQAARSAGITKPVGPHTFRQREASLWDSFAIGLENGYDSFNRAATSGLSMQYTASRGVINFP